MTYLRSECGDFSAVVERREPATSSALAHEACHAAGVPESEAPSCAAEINDSVGRE